MVRIRTAFLAGAAAAAAAVAASFLLAEPPSAPPPGWPGLHWERGGTTLDLHDYRLVWGDDFTNCDIGEDRGFQSAAAGDPKSSEPHRWYWTKETFHLAKFVPPSATPSPYRCANGRLSITLSNPTGQQWQSGIISANGSAQRGFTRNFPYSYFEARIMLPPPPAGLSPWPAFWFRSPSATRRGGSDPVLEVDVIEPGLASATDLTLQATTVHEWPAQRPRPGDITEHRAMGYNDHYVTFDGQWHTYGLLRTPRWFIVYMDGTEQRRFPVADPVMRMPIYPIIDLALKYPPSAGPDARYSMYVDYVRAFACAGGPACDR